MNSGFVACGCQLIPLSGSAQRETIGIGPIVECKHFRHPADEQLRISIEFQATTICRLSSLILYFNPTTLP